MLTVTRKKNSQIFFPSASAMWKFIGAAIENSMAVEIYKQLQKGKLDNAANLTNDEQLTAVCAWILNL